MTIALIVILVILVLYVIITYNKFVTLKKQMNNSYSVIDVYLKKRFDLIPNLVEVTKGYANYEQDVLTKITEYRTAYNQHKDKDALNKLNEEYNNLILVVENYPDLKASEQFLKLQKSLIKVESELQAARRIYNSDTTKYNTKLNVFPSNIIGKIFNFKEGDLFELEDRKIEGENIKVDM
jgi:LemA protein|uniref:LemA family protein n=1 Tax=Candidatus Merdicola sp. TaxID=3085652 RepID=UPI003FEFFA68